MNDQTMTMPTMKVAVASKENANYVAGRRAFFKYRDLGVTEGTGGFMRAQVTSAEQGMSKETGWHVHKCQAQLVYMLSGWVDLEFADRKVRVKAGDSIMIPFVVGGAEGAAGGHAAHSDVQDRRLACRSEWACRRSPRFAHPKTRARSSE